MKKLKDCEEPLERMMASFAHFGDSLGPVLYQLPPHFTLDLPRLEDFLRIAPRHPVPVFEFRHPSRSEEHTSELQSLMRISYAVFCLKKKQVTKYKTKHTRYV